MRNMWISKDANPFKHSAGHRTDYGGVAVDLLGGDGADTFRDRAGRHGEAGVATRGRPRSNIAIVVGDRAIVVDTGLGARNGATIAREARKLSKGTRLYLTTTHFHPEHAAATRVSRRTRC